MESNVINTTSTKMMNYVRKLNKRQKIPFVIEKNFKKFLIEKNKSC